MFLKMLTGTRADEDESYENIIICISMSTLLMVFTSIMEALTYYLYNNKVQILLRAKYKLFSVPSKERDYWKATMKNPDALRESNTEGNIEN